MTRIGVLALQGDFAEHRTALKNLGVESLEVRLPAQLDGLDGLIIPGGESTTIARLMDIYELREPLRHRAKMGLAVWGTCAGMILMAEHVEEDVPEPLGLMNIRVRRNAYGRQVDSFETDLRIPELNEPLFHCVFIRAPKIEAVGEGVDVLSTDVRGGVVAVRQEKLLATAFHPELTSDTRFHQYFLTIAEAPLP
ncbi:MAG: pyridoxal 5'-phosphate synthase glutaminase subunit PdxT [Chloroflexota bacterium]|nr:pyridoxal 5'-phosphate synthase glutaminase subunit PdxT [Chloroflexota bacterium]